MLLFDFTEAKMGTIYKFMLWLALIENKWLNLPYIIRKMIKTIVPFDYIKDSCYVTIINVVNVKVQLLYRNIITYTSNFFIEVRFF